MTALCSAGMGEGEGCLCSAATAGRVPAHVEGLSVNRRVQECKIAGLRTASSLQGEGRI